MVKKTDLYQTLTGISAYNLLRAIIMFSLCLTKVILDGAEKEWQSLRHDDKDIKTDRILPKFLFFKYLQFRKYAPTVSVSDHVRDPIRT